MPLPDDYTSEEQLIQDALILFKGRWGIEGNMQHDENNRPYGWLLCSRFTAGKTAIQAALGDMFPTYILFHRGTVNETAEDAKKYVDLCVKWNVSPNTGTQEREDNDTGMSKVSSSGNKTEWSNKRRR